MSNVSLKSNQRPSGENLVGIGLRSNHYHDLIETKPDIGWVEIHPENYFGGGEHRDYLAKARELYPVSFHSVGLSWGSTDRVSQDHLKQIKELIDIYEPFQISDHASWSASGNAHLNDLLPLPYTDETLAILCRNINETQEFLERTVLVENPSTYISFKESTMPEWEFMNEAAKQTGCGILLDVNNIFVQSHNHNFDAYEYLREINIDPVGEIHLAGHIEQEMGNGETILIDTHNKNVRSEVWDLYRFTIDRFGKILTLIEWDQDLPELEELVKEAHRARAVIDGSDKPNATI